MADLVLIAIWAYATVRALGFVVALVWMGLCSFGRWLVGLESPRKRLERGWREYEARLRLVAGTPMPRVRDPITPAERVRRMEALAMSV